MNIKFSDMKQASYYLLDVFTSVKFGGNPLAVFPDARMIDPAKFQLIARELNLSETVFLTPPSAGQPHYSMRIFTPGKELPTAGHPTIGTAFYLSREIQHPSDQAATIQLQQQVGLISVEVNFQNNLPDMVTMYQPLPVFGQEHPDLRDELAHMLGLSVTELDDAPIQEISCGNNTLLIPVKTAATLSRIHFNMGIWERLRHHFNDALIYVFSVNGVIGADVQGRMFGPSVGIMEDPATGSANGPLACYLAHHGLCKMPALSLQGYEMGRPSQLYLDIRKDSSGNIDQVKVGGRSVYVGQGSLFLDFD